MKIIIDDNRTLEQIREDFNARFPLLKLEFFVKPHDRNGESPKEEMLEACTTLRSLRSVNGEGALVITADMTVAEVEKAFREHFGLNAQVFRLSGKNWLETTVTDGWTLAKQSEQAAILQSPAE